MKALRVIVGVVIIEIAVTATLAPRTDRARIQSTDFVNFYAAAAIVLHGNGAQLYQRETQDAEFRSLLGHESNQYFLHPPFEAAALAPLALLKIENAFVLWSLVNVALLGLLPLLLMQSIPLIGRRPYLALLGFCFLPALTALTLGQDSILLVFVFCWAYGLMFQKRDFAAGLVLALAAIKFQYLAILILLLLVSRRWRIGAGCAAGCAVLAFISALITGPHGLWEYVQFVRDFDAHAGYGALNLALMVNFRGFLAGIGFSDHWTAYAGAAVLFAIGVVASQMVHTEWNDGLLFALYLTIALVAAPYAHFPDMTILLLPVLLAWNHVAVTGSNTLPRKLILFCCAAMFVWPFLLLILGGHYWWNSRIHLVFPLIVIFIGALATECYSGKCAGATAVS